MNKLVINNEKLTGLVADICRVISNSGWRPDYIVGLTRGGLVPAVMISQYFDIPLHTLNVSLRDSDLCPESNFWMAEDALGQDISTKPIDGDSVEKILESAAVLLEEGDTYKNILIIDDINDSGATINWIIDDWRSSCRPNDPTWISVWNNNVKFAVLVDNQASKCNVKMDFVGMEINKAEHDVWVDFPWEDWWSK